MIFKNGEPKSDLNGFLDAGSHVQGELHFEHTFRLDGRITGRVVSDGTLIVGEAGHLDGEAEVAQIFISGKVEGAVTASRRIQVAAKGKVYADLETPSLLIEDGALFEGKCSMSQRGGRTAGTGSAGNSPRAEGGSAPGAEPEPAAGRGGKVAHMRPSGQSSPGQGAAGQGGPRRAG